MRCTLSVVVTGEHSPGPRSRLHRKEKVQGCSVGIKVSFKRLWNTHPIDNNQKSEQANPFSMHLHEALTYKHIKPEKYYTTFNLIPHNLCTVIRECISVLVYPNATQQGSFFPHQTKRSSSASNL